MEIIDIQMRDLMKRIKSMGITVELNKQAKEFLADKGFDPAYGARPLRRALQRFLEDPIAEELLKGKYPEGTKIKVRLNKKKGELRFSSTSVAPAKTGGPVTPPEEKPAGILSLGRQADSRRTDVFPGTACGRFRPAPELQQEPFPDYREGTGKGVAPRRRSRVTVPGRPGRTERRSGGPGAWPGLLRLPSPG